MILESGDGCGEGGSSVPEAVFNTADLIVAGPQRRPPAAAPPLQGGRPDLAPREEARPPRSSAPARAELAARGSPGDAESLRKPQVTTEDLDQQSPGKASLSCGPAFGALDSESRQPGRGRGEAERQFLGSPWGGADGGGLGKWVWGRRAWSWAACSPPGGPGGVSFSAATRSEGFHAAINGQFESGRRGSPPPPLRFV